jgi:hypothetical protein
MPASQTALESRARRCKESKLRGSFYEPGRGGHAPGDLRDAFLDALERFERYKDGEPEPIVELRNEPTPISKVFKLLWNCDDILDGLTWTRLSDLSNDWEMPTRKRTYAAAARFLCGLMAG